MSITKKVVVSIERTKVMQVVEGLSVTISQHNGGVPSYEQLWASESERKKLDIYYREAVGDLERRLMEWLTTTTSQYDLSATGTDYTLTLVLNYWPSKLEGLLKNKIQDYLVHSITAGWLNDFEGLNVKNDYQAIAGQDLTDIQIIIFQRVFGFDTEERAADSNKPEGEGGGNAETRNADSNKPEGEGGGSTEERTADSNKPEGEGGGDAESRTADSNKPEGEGGGNAETRNADSNKPEGEGGGDVESRNADSNKPEGEGGGTAEARTADSNKPEGKGGGTAGDRLNSRDEFKNYDEGGVETSMRNRDQVKSGCGTTTNRTRCCCDRTPARNRDNAVNRHHADWTDWSGVGLPPMRCRHQDDVPQCTVEAATQSQHTGQMKRQHTGQMKRQHTGQMRRQCIQTEEGPGHTGQDDPEVYMQEHVCGGGEHLCGHHGVNKLDW